MQADFWQQVERFFHAALELEPTARRGFLDRACGDDAALRTEVEALLAADAEDLAYLEVPAGRISAFSEAELEGTPIGPYQVLHRLGDGGMGAVYLAERADGHFRKRVALKLVKRGMDTEDVLGRFRAEREILAALDHPGIARLLDGGVIADGRPYFVMEYVEAGMPITDYSDRHHLSIPERLRLFVRVCEAVAYAHRNLVVHRDLKPSNVLVSGEGAAKLLDFGIAKLLAPGRVNLSAPRTRKDVRVMTPEYAAPEQVKGEAITTATDVYGLGVLLYELLTGRQPYRLRGRSTEEVTRVICEETPAKPSTIVAAPAPEDEAADGARPTTPAAISAARGTDPTTLRRRLRGDLDTIVLKAMAKEPHRRYGSAEALAQDVERYLEGLPLAARPDALGYRLAKFVRRHRVGVVAACGGLLLLVSFGVAMAALAVRTARQAEALAVERDKAEQVVQVLVDLFETSNPERVPGGDTLRVGAFLERGEAQVLERLEDQPAVQATMRRVLGRMHMARSRYDRARPLLEAALTQQRALGGADDPEAAKTLHDLALLTHRSGNQEAARALFEESLALHRRLRGDEHEEVARAMQDLAPLVDDDVEQLRLLNAALAIRRKVLPAVSVGNAASLNQLGVYHFTRKQHAEASRYFRETLDVLTQLKGPNHPHVLAVKHNLASSYASLDRLEEAERLHRDVLAARRRIVGDTTMAAAGSLRELGNVLARQRRYAEAEAAYRESLTFLEALKLHEAHPHIAVAHHNLGRILQVQRRYAEALPTLLRAYALYQQQGAEEAGWHVAAYVGLVQHHLGQRAEGLRRTRMAVEWLQRRAPEEGDAALAHARLLLGLMLLAEAQPVAAEAHFRDMLAFRADAAADRQKVREAECALGCALAAQSRTAEAVGLIRRACPAYVVSGLAEPALIDASRPHLAPLGPSAEAAAIGGGP